MAMCANLQFKLARTTHSARPPSQPVLAGLVRQGSCRIPPPMISLEQLAADVVILMRDAPPTTVVHVFANGQIIPRLPGAAGVPGIDRRRQPVATFVVS